MKIIDITKKLSTKKNKWAVEAMTALQKSEDPNGIIRLISYIFVMECEIGLGLLDEGDDLELQFFNEINDVYQQAAGDCYFCKDIDPNEIKVDKDTLFCMMCRKKLVNLLVAVGIDPSEILFGVHKK